MIEFLLSPGMKTKAPTMSWNVGYGSTFGKKYKKVREDKNAVTFRPAKDGWYPLNVIWKKSYD